MPDITIVKFKVRRGTNSEREKVVLDQGELGYTLDTKRLFVGTGLSGGIVVGSKNFGAFNLESGLGATVGAQIGDFGYANSKLYTLTAESYTSDLDGWGYIGPVPDDVNIEFTADNTLTLKTSSIDANDLKNEAFGVALKRNDTAIDLRYSTLYFEISDGDLTLKDSAINVANISTAVLSRGLSGGGGVPIVVLPGRGLEYTTDDEGTVRIATSNTTTRSVLFSALDLNMFGQGLRVNHDLKLVTATLSGVDANDFNVRNATIHLLTRSVSGNYELPYFTVDDKGITVDVASTFYDTMTATTLTGGDFVPVGTVLPHAAAIGKVPQGYLLCDGGIYSKPAYQDLYDVIGTDFNLGPEPGGYFRVPSLTGGELLYGNNQNPNINSAGSPVYYLSAAGYPGPTAPALSAVDITFIIKATSNINGIFTGAPNQITEGFKHSGTTYSGVDSDGIAQTLSSAGFLTLSLSGQTRKNDATFDKFAIPIFNY